MPLDIKYCQRDEIYHILHNIYKNCARVGFGRWYMESIGKCDQRHNNVWKRDIQGKVCIVDYHFYHLCPSIDVCSFSFDEGYGYVVYVWTMSFHIFYMS